MKNGIALALYCLTSASVLYAKDYTDSLLDLSWEELAQVKVIIASGTEQYIHKTPSTVTVITADDIKNTGATNLTDILESVPGIHINANPFGFRPLIHMRGSNSHQTLLMVDGNPMKDLVWAFGIFWKGLPVSMIERVEVIRGPGSALYGADAVAGVVNVITKAAGKIENTEMGVRVGSYDTQAAWAQLGGDWNGLDIGMTVDLSKTDGHEPFIESDGQTVRDPGNSTAPDKAQYGWKNADVRFSIANDNWRFLVGFMRHSHLETGITGAGNLDPVTDGKDERLDLDLIYNNKNFSKDWGVDAKFHYQYLRYDSGDGFRESPPTSIYPDGLLNHMSSGERQLGFETSGLYSGISSHNIRIGAGYQWQDLYRVEQQVNFGTGADGNPLPAGGPIVDISDTSFAFAPEKIRKIRFLFLQDIWTLSDTWELTMGARYDYYSDFGDTLNPRLALIWQSTEQLTTKLLYGQAFRTPSFQELYADTSRALSNSSLKPEESETLELAFSYAATKNLQLALNLYELEITNNIFRLPIAGTSQKQYQNTGRHKTVGVEIEASWQATKNLKISGNYSYRNPEDSDFRVVQEPEQSAYLRSDWRFQPGWHWNAQANWIADRSRTEKDSRSAVADYVVTDMTLRYTGLKQWEFVTSVRNLFDEDAREHTGGSIANDLPLPERSFYAEIRYKL